MCCQQIIIPESWFATRLNLTDSSEFDLFSTAPLLSNTEAWLQDDGKCPPDVDMNGEIVKEDLIPTVQAESMHEQHMSAPTLPNSNQDVSSYQTQMSCQRYIVWCF
jgi:hypothetical protein